MLRQTSTPASIITVVSTCRELLGTTQEADQKEVSHQEALEALLELLRTCCYVCFIYIGVDNTRKSPPPLDSLQSTRYVGDRAVIHTRIRRDWGEHMW